MPRHRPPAKAADHDWYLREWMATLRVKQADLARRTGWSVATTNDIFHGRTAYYRQLVNDAAAALNLAPHELFLPPEEAMAIRRMRESALSIAAETRTEWTTAPVIKRFGEP